MPSAVASAAPIPVAASFDIKPWTDYPLIAHANGGIDGKDYTNSLDAFKQSYKKGFRVFETDLILTSDNELVARND